MLALVEIPSGKPIAEEVDTKLQRVFLTLRG